MITLDLHSLLSLPTFSTSFFCKRTCLMFVSFILSCNSLNLIIYVYINFKLYIGAWWNHQLVYKWLLIQNLPVANSLLEWDLFSWVQTWVTIDKWLSQTCAGPYLYSPQLLWYHYCNDCVIIRRQILSTILLTSSSLFPLNATRCPLSSNGGWSNVVLDLSTQIQLALGIMSNSESLHTS